MDAEHRGFKTLFPERDGNSKHTKTIVELIKF